MINTATASTELRPEGWQDLWQLLSLPWQRAHVTLTQRAVRLRDHDNFAASFKPGLDALVRAGIIADDKPSVIDLSLRAEKVQHEAEEEVVVEVVRLDGEHEWCHSDG